MRCHALESVLLMICRYVYDRKAEPALGNIIGEWFTRKFHNAKTLVRNFAPMSTSRQRCPVALTGAGRAHSGGCHWLGHKP